MTLLDRNGRRQMNLIYLGVQNYGVPIPASSKYLATEPLLSK